MDTQCIATVLHTSEMPEPTTQIITKEHALRVEEYLKRVEKIDREKSM